MSREIPEIVRAAAGLAATVLDEARKLPETLPGLPVRVIGMAMQHAMKVQQAYAGLVARGDELLTGLRGDGEPGLATFDDDDADASATAGFRDSAFDRASDDATAPVLSLVEEAPLTEEVLDELAIDEAVPEVADTDPLTTDAPATDNAGALDAALRASDAATDGGSTDPATADAADVDIVTSDGGIDTVETPGTDDGASVDTASVDTADAEDIAGPVDLVGSLEVAASVGITASVDAEETAEAEEIVGPVDFVGSVGAAASADVDTDETGAGTDTAAAGTNAGPTEAVDESGSPVAAATGVATDVSDVDTTDEDTADTTGAQAAGTAPVEGYDSFSIAQLRGRLRGYALSTVSDLLAYEQATRNRDPYLRMLRNRLGKLEEQAVASSPLAPRGL